MDAGTLVTLSHRSSGTGSPATPVTRAPFNETVHLDGLIEAVQQSTVSAQTSGTVVELPFDVDDSVAAGDLIVRLEDSEQQSRLRQAEAGLEEARSGLQDARQQYTRIEAIHERGLVRSEEHTSELQSRPHLVCRLLL